MGLGELSRRAAAGWNDVNIVQADGLRPVTGRGKRNPAAVGRVAGTVVDTVGDHQRRDRSAVGRNGGDISRHEARVDSWVGLMGEDDGPSIRRPVKPLNVEVSRGEALGLSLAGFSRLDFHGVQVVVLEVLIHEDDVALLFLSLLLFLRLRIGHRVREVGAVGRPAIRSDAGISLGDLLRFTAHEGHDPDLVLAAPRAGKGQVSAVRRERRTAGGLIALGVLQVALAVGGNDPDVAQVLGFLAFH